MTAPSIVTDLVSYNFDLETVDFLSRFSLKTDAHDLMGQTFMHELAREGDVLSAEALLAAGCEIDRADDEGRRPLHEAAFFGRLDMVKFLTRNGALMDAPIHPFGYTALYYAVEQGHHAVVRTLLAAGANIGVIDRLSGHGLLLIAAIRGDLEMSGILIAAGIDVFAEDKKGLNARDHAAKYNHTALEQVLLKVMQHHARR